MQVLLIEDEKRISDLIKRGLEEQGYIVTTASDGSSGRTFALTLQFDLVIMDILLPDIYGIDLCKEIRNVKSSLPIIMLTALGTTDDKVEGFDAGADDYIVKPFDFRELLVRIRALLKRKLTQADEASTLLQFADIEMDLNTKTVKRNNKELNLTPKEFKLLEYMLNHPNRVLSRNEIAEKVWDTRFDTGTNFIDVYINYLRKKVDKDFDHKLIHTKPGMGFILKSE